MKSYEQSDYQLVRYEEDGTGLWLIRDAKRGRAYGPYWEKEHADDFMRLVLKTRPAARRTVFKFIKITFAGTVAAVMSYTLGVTPHEYCAALIVGFFVLICA